MPPAFDDIEPWNSMSLENITLLSGAKLFVMVRNEREAGAFRELSASPLWQTIPAVQNDAVEIVNWNVWVAGWNIVGANLVIDDLYFYMLGREPAQPNPLNDLVVPGFGPQNDAVRLGMEG
jgi:iron complex transport system substrate-binding protein